MVYDIQNDIEITDNISNDIPNGCHYANSAVSPSWRRAIRKAQRRFKSIAASNIVIDQDAESAPASAKSYVKLDSAA